MDRRNFIQTSSKIGIVSVVGLGGWGLGGWGRMELARHRMKTELTENAMPVLSRKAHAEFDELPPKARESMRDWFHNAALNSAEFVEHICSATFAEKLRIATTEEQKQLVLLNAFVSKVVTEAEILNRVQIVAEEIGAELDHNWSIACAEISDKWELHISQRHRTNLSDDLLGRADPIVRSQLDAAIAQARAATLRPALSGTVSQIGAAAILALPLSPQIGIPVFVLLAGASVWQYISGLLEVRRGNYTRAISDRLSVLANRVGAEFESEVRHRIGQLHVWQEQALDDVARESAEQRIGLLS